MANKTYTKSVLATGSEHSLDNIDGADLSDGDRAVVTTIDEETYHYYLSAGSGATADGIRVISPVESAGTKRWLLTTPIGKDNYYPKVSATDQGLTGDNDTLKYYVDLLSGETGTIKLRPGTYTLSTDVIITSGITLHPVPGAIVDGSGALTFAAGSHLDIEKGRCFGDDITVVFGAGVMDQIHPEWWYGDGGDYATAISKSYAAAYQGAEISFEDKEYPIGSTIEIGIKPVILRGVGTAYKGGGTVLGSRLKLITGSECDMIDINGDDPDQSEHLGYQRITNLGFDGNRGGQTSTSIDIIKIGPSKRVQIDHCTFAFSSQHGISTYSETVDSTLIFPGSLDVNHNFMIYNGNAAARTGNGIALTAAADSVIKNNNVNWSGGTNISTGAAGNIIISGNRVDDSYSYGIYMASRGIVTNNICNNNDGAGIYVYSPNVIVTNNFCLGNGEDSATSFTDPQRSGILIGSTFTGIVSGNLCNDDGGLTQQYGIYITAGATGIVKNNSCDGNVTQEMYIPINAQIQAEKQSVQISIAAGTNDGVPITSFYSAPNGIIIFDIILINAATISQSDINYTTLTFTRRDTTGSANGDIIARATDLAGMNITQFKPLQMSSSLSETNRVAANGRSVSVSKVDTGTGAALDNMVIEIVYATY